MQTQADKTYQKITERIISLLEQGVVPWRRPWTRGLTPMNPYTPTVYRGINSMLIWAVMLEEGWKDPRFGSYHQIKAAGGVVKKGSEGVPVVYYVPIMDRDVQGGDEPQVKYLRPKYWTVFNLVEQTEGLDITPVEVSSPSDFTPIELAETTLRAYVNQEYGPGYNHDGGNSAFYRPSNDTIYMPGRHRFENPDRYYNVAFHEMTHSTGHTSRLAREGVAKVDSSNIERYSKEELVAEMGATFLCAECDIEPDMENTAAYIGGWLKELKDDPKLVMQASAEAQKAVEFILSKQLVTANV